MCVNNNLKDYGNRKTWKEFKVSRDVENNIDIIYLWIKFSKTFLKSVIFSSLSNNTFLFAGVLSV